MTIEIHELIIEAYISDDAVTDIRKQQAGEMALKNEQQLIERITQQVLRQVLTHLHEEPWGIR